VDHAVRDDGQVRLLRVAHYATCFNQVRRRSFLLLRLFPNETSLPRPIFKSAISQYAAARLLGDEVIAAQAAQYGLRTTPALSTVFDMLDGKEQARWVRLTLLGPRCDQHSFPDAPTDVLPSAAC
jgi:hypothetical protein